MRVIDLDTGDTLQAANDEDLAKVVSSHMKEHGGGGDYSDEEIEKLIASRAYTATDS